MPFRFSDHATEEVKRRGIPMDLVRSSLASPQQIITEREGRKAYQSQVDFGEGNVFLLRVIVADNIDPAVVVTVYRTRKIAKYWRSP